MPPFSLAQFRESLRRRAAGGRIASCLVAVLAFALANGVSAWSTELTPIDATDYVRTARSTLAQLINHKHWTKIDDPNRTDTLWTGQEIDQLWSALRRGEAIIAPETSGYPSGGDAMRASSTFCPGIERYANAFPAQPPQYETNVQRYLVHADNDSSEAIRWIAIRREILFTSVQNRGTEGLPAADFFAYLVPDCEMGKLKLPYLGDPEKNSDIKSDTRPRTVFAELFLIDGAFAFVAITDVPSGSRYPQGRYVTANHLRADGRSDSDPELALKLEDDR
jgi:hypothetical protein